MSESIDAMLDALVEAAGEHARRILVELQKPLVPSWVLVTEDHKLQIVGTPWEADQEKHRYEKKLRALMRLKNVVAYSFVTEAWAATLEPGEWDEATGYPKDGKTASKRPDRQEVVIACACTQEQTRWRQWRIVREATTERIVGLEDKPMVESDRAPESWLADMLK